MALGGGILRDEVKRLLRLSAAQMEFLRLLECRVISAQQKLDEVEKARVGTLAALDRAGSSGLMLYVTAMRRLADLECAKAKNEQALKDCTRKLMEARGRHDFFQRRADQLKSAEERKSLEEEAGESALLLKATGKHDVMK